MISVYRMYLGRSFVEAGAVDSLLALFDGLPEFLHVAGKLENGPETEAGSAISPRSAVKVAMTHAHVAVLRDAASDDPARSWTEHEIGVARGGFRRRIPIVAVRMPGDTTTGTSASALRRAADRIVDWDGVEIARAVKELADEAETLHRTEFDRISPQAFGPSLSIPRLERSTEHVECRALPVQDILSAYERLKATR